MRKVNKAIKILVVFLFFVQTSTYLFQPLLAVFIIDFVPEASISVVGFAMTFFALSKALVQVPTAKLLDRQKGERDDFYVMVSGAVLGTVVSFAYLVVSSVPQLYFISVLSGIAAAFLMAAFYSIFSHHIDSDAQGFEWSLFSAGSLTIGAAMGGAVGGMLVELFSFKLVFFAAGTISLVSAVLLLGLYPLLDGFRPPKHKLEYVKIKDRRKVQKTAQ